LWYFSIVIAHSARCLSKIFVALLIYLLGLLGAAGRAELVAETFWDVPVKISADNSAFVQTASNSAGNRMVAAAAWQTVESYIGADGDLSEMIFLNMMVKNGHGSWEKRERIAGPYRFGGNQPSIFNLAVDNRGFIYISVALSTNISQIMVSEDLGRTFSRYDVETVAADALAPKIFPMDNGGLLMFVSRSVNETITLYYCRSADGYIWSEFEAFVDENLSLNFLPSHATLGKTEYVVFQSFVSVEDTTPSFQLFLKTSLNGGRTWSIASQVTIFNDPYMYQNTDWTAFNNERPSLTVFGDTVFLAWERRFGSADPYIYGLFIDRAGLVTGDIELISEGGGYCNNPITQNENGRLSVMWFDNRLNNINHAFAAERTLNRWPNQALSSGLDNATLVRSVLTDDGIYAFWETNEIDEDAFLEENLQNNEPGTFEVPEGTNVVFMLAPDITVARPKLNGINFDDNVRTNQTIARIRYRSESDASGISGYSYIWSRDKTALPKREILLSADTDNVSLEAESDGTWYFTMMTEDFAGNWSAVSTITFIRDRTPPPAAEIIPPRFDADGFLSSNNIVLEWMEPPASDLAGYTWALDYLGPPGMIAAKDTNSFLAGIRASVAAKAIAEPHLPLEVRQVPPVLRLSNYDNGTYRFTVRPIDEVGNIGPARSVFFRLNKYIPYTNIRYVVAEQDEFGILSLRILGRGFRDDGVITQVYITPVEESGGIHTNTHTRDFYRRANEFELHSDREIFIPKIEYLDEGSYKVVLVHPSRGEIFSPASFDVGEALNIKFGDYSNRYEGYWSTVEKRRFELNGVGIATAAFFALCLIILGFCISGIRVAYTESKTLKLELIALMAGNLMPEAKKAALKMAQHKGISLRIKLSGFTVGIVILVVAMVSFPLYQRMTDTQRETLLQGLWDRSSVLIDGVVTSSRVFLPSNNVLELGYLPQQTAAIPEAKYITITGYGAEEDSIDSDYVWATNDTNILEKIDTTVFEPGVSRITDVLSTFITDFKTAVNAEAVQRVGELSSTIAELTEEGISLAVNTDELSQSRASDIQATTRGLEERITRELSDLSKNVGSYPEYSTASYKRTNTDFILYKSVLFRQGNSSIYQRGIVRLEISISTIIDEIEKGQRELLRVILLFASAAITIGAVSSMVLANLIIKPIRELVSHVERIRDTENKTEL
jgi:hypothetical protein